MNTDKQLCQNVYNEMIGDYQIIGMITRFGGFVVFVNKHSILQDGYEFGIWQGDNILAAREWIKLPKTEIKFKNIK